MIVIITLHYNIICIFIDWGIKQWVPFLLDLLLDGDTVTTEMVMQYLLGTIVVVCFWSYSLCI